MHGPIHKSCCKTSMYKRLYIYISENELPSLNMGDDHLHNHIQNFFTTEINDILGTYPESLDKILIFHPKSKYFLIFR